MFRAFLIAIPLLLALPPAVGGETHAFPSEIGDQAPADRIREAVRQAWGYEANLAEIEATIEAERIAARRQTRAGPPYIEYQREGIDDAFGNALNATKYVRVGKPFNFPWQWRVGKALVSATEAFSATARKVATMEVTREVGLAWIRLAALQERVSVQEGQLDRSRRALRLHRERFEMGEVSGFEVTQVELECARRISELESLRAEMREAQVGFERLTGDERWAPVPGDLRRLTEAVGPLRSTGTPSPDVLEESPFVRLARERTEQAHRSADLARNLAWGRPEVEVEWEHVPSVDGMESFDAFGWRVQIPLPVDRSGWDLRKESLASQTAAEARERAARREVAARVRSAFAMASAAEERLKAMAGLRTDLPEAARSLSEQFRLGVLSYLVYFDGLSRLDQVVLQHVEAGRSLLEARLELAVVLGDRTLFPLPELPPEDPP